MSLLFGSQSSGVTALLKHHQRSRQARTLTLLPIVAVGFGTGGREFIRVETAALLPSLSPSLSVRGAAEVGAVYGVLGLFETGPIAMKTP